MTVHLKKSIPPAATPITVVDRASFQNLAAQLPATTRRWLETVAFTGAADSHVLLPDAQGKLAQVFAGVARADHPFVLAALAQALPEGSYALASQGLRIPAEQAALSWALGAYEFDRYKPRRRALEVDPLLPVS